MRQRGVVRGFEDLLPRAPIELGVQGPLHGTVPTLDWHEWMNEYDTQNVFARYLFVMPTILRHPRSGSKSGCEPSSDCEFSHFDDW